METICALNDSAWPPSCSLRPWSAAWAGWSTTLRAGADDPRYSPRERQEMEAREPSLAALTSETNKRPAVALREAMEAAAVVERERGQEAWMSEMLGDYVSLVEEELHGPASGRGRE